MQWWWIICFLPILIILWDNKSHRKKIARIIMLRKKHSNKIRGIEFMTELVKDFIGKDCIVYTMDGQVCGIIESVNDNWIVINENEDKSIINGEFVSRIREYPVNKKGKRKSIV